ncbi:MAG TPA: SRPBCC domain-containing protein [Longimicrobiales bacterium]|nr:SRPBCC domain-containing protein [Longimicrobiales bacterium]
MTKREETSTAPRILEIVREIDAPAEAVWRALSDAEELRRWFPLDARVEPRPQGSIWPSWGPGCETEAPLHAWEPGRRLGGAGVPSFSTERSESRTRGSSWSAGRDTSRPSCPP